MSTAQEDYRGIAQRTSFVDVPPTCEDVAHVLGVLQEKYNIAESDIDFARKMIKRLATGRLREAWVKDLARLLRAQDGTAQAGVSP